MSDDGFLWGATLDGRYTLSALQDETYPFLGVLLITDGHRIIMRRRVELPMTSIDVEYWQQYSLRVIDEYEGHHRKEKVS